MTAGTDKSVFLEPTAPAAPAAIRSFYLQGPAGRLEALLNEGIYSGLYDPDNTLQL